MSTNHHQARVWTVFLTFVAYVASGVAAGILVLIPFFVLNFSLIRVVDPKDLVNFLEQTLSAPPWFAALAISSGLAGMAVTFGAAWLSPESIRSRLGILQGCGRPWFLVVGVSCIAVFSASLVADSLLTLLFGDLSENLARMERSVQNSEQADYVLLVISVAILAPLAEELIFRGFIQRRLIVRFGPFFAVAVTSLLFALVHFDVQHSFFALLLGIVLGFVALRTDSIWPSILGHACVNLWYAVATRFFPSHPSTTEQLVTMAFAAVVLAVSLVALYRLTQMDCAETPG